MGLFSGLLGHDDDKEREAAQRHREAQQRLADARRHQQERQQEQQHQGVTAQPDAPREHSTYPETSWRKEFDQYVVKRGDTLYGIARQVYGDGNAWTRIQHANPIVLKNPDLIHPGLVLRIPKGTGSPLA
jgi:nucleoid-associated protein YgaU